MRVRVQMRGAEGGMAMANAELRTAQRRAAPPIDDTPHSHSVPLCHTMSRRSKPAEPQPPQRTQRPAQQPTAATAAHATAAESKEEQEERYNEHHRAMRIAFLHPNLGIGQCRRDA